MIELKPRRKKVQRRKDAPVIAPKKRRPMGRPDPVRRARILAITARTRAARAELTALIAGAPKMPEIDCLPVMVPDTSKPRRRKKTWRRYASMDEDEDDLVETEKPPRKKISAKLPRGPRLLGNLRDKKPTRCSRCGQTGHNTRTCHTSPAEAFNARRR